VYTKLRNAGAILVAKLSTGALAFTAQWFGGVTRNPWNLQQDAAGSSAGPGSATAAGLVASRSGPTPADRSLPPSARNGSPACGRRSAE
jgi:Asp-tRNAAsn/Glu-tRNAGln amidotransferase A subunit and related amidases